MNPEEMNALAESYFEAVCEGDATKLRSLFSKDVLWRIPKGAIPPYGGPHTRADNIIDIMLGAVPHSFKTRTQLFDVRTTLIADDVVCKETEMSAVAPDGRTYQNDYTFFFVIREGLICEIREHVDTRYAADFFS